MSNWVVPLWLAPPWSALKNCTLDAVSALPFAVCHSPRSINVHVGGSGSLVACWAFVVLWEDVHRQWFFGGTRMGPVILDPLHPEYVGASMQDSISGELSEMVWSLMFDLQFCNAAGRPPSQCDVFYDSEVAAHSANCTWGSYGSLARVATSLYSLLHTVSTLGLRQEHGHAGLPYNVFAGYGERQCHLATTFETTPALALVGCDVAGQWMFILTLPGDKACQYPIVMCGDEIFLSTSACPDTDLGVDSSIAASSIDDFQAGDKAAVGDASMMYRSSPLLLVQINANALRPPTKCVGFLKPFRRSYVHMGGMQETRRPILGISSECGYILAQPHAMPMALAVLCLQSLKSFLSVRRSTGALSRVKFLLTVSVPALRSRVLSLLALQPPASRRLFWSFMVSTAVTVRKRWRNSGTMRFGTLSVSANVETIS